MASAGCSGVNHPLQVYVPWLSGEMRRNDPVSVVQAGQALESLRRPAVGAANWACLPPR